MTIPKNTNNRPLRIYSEPANLEEAEQRERDLIYDLNVIHMQLGDETRRQRMAEEFAAWKTKALGARVNKTDELSWLKSWIRNRRAALRANIGTISRDNPNELLVAARWVLKNLHADGVDLDDTEFGILDALNEYCDHHA
jgi:hypothetical protein